MDLDAFEQLFEEHQRKKRSAMLEELEVFAQNAVNGDPESIARLKRIFSNHLAVGKSVTELPGLLTHVAVMAYCNGDGTIDGEIRRLSALQLEIGEASITRREEATYLEAISKIAFKDLYYCDLSGTFISVHAEVNRCHDAKN